MVINLVTCEGCGVVLNTDFIPKEQDEPDASGYETLKEVWNDDESCFMQVIKCPVCKDDVLVHE